MSWELLKQAYGEEILALGLDEHALGVYRVLCNCHNSETGRCDPSAETVAAMLNIGKRTVERAYASLRATGLIVTGQKHDRRGYVAPGLNFTILTASQALRPDRLTGGADAVPQAEPTPSHRRSNGNQEENQEMNQGVAPAPTLDLIMGEWIRSYKTCPTTKTVREIRQQVAALLEEGTDPDAIAGGLQRWKNKQLPTRFVPDMVQDVINAAESITFAGRMPNKAEQRQAENLAMVARMAELDRQEAAKREALAASLTDVFAMKGIEQ